MVVCYNRSVILKGRLCEVDPIKAEATGGIRKRFRTNKVYLCCRILCARPSVAAVEECVQCIQLGCGREMS